MTSSMPSPSQDDTDYVHNHPEWDDREWDSAHCCSCCCECCACHKISHAFWWVLVFTVACLGAGAALFIDGVVKQQNCNEGLNQDNPESLNAYDSCRQSAFIQILASIGLGVLFLVMVFVSCCAFMDVLCFRRWRSRPHLQRSQQPLTPRVARQGLTPRGNFAAYDNLTQLAPPPPLQPQQQQQMQMQMQQQQQQQQQQLQMQVLVNGNGYANPGSQGQPRGPRHIQTNSGDVVQQYNPYSAQRSARTPNMYLAHDQMRRQQHPPHQQQLTPQQQRSHVTPPSYSNALSPMPSAPQSARSAPAPILLATPGGAHHHSASASSSPMPTLGEQMRLAAALPLASSSASPADAAGTTPMVLLAPPVIPPRPAAVHVAIAAQMVPTPSAPSDAPPS